MSFRDFRERFRGSDDEDSVIHAAKRFRLGQLEELDADEFTPPYNWEESPGLVEDLMADPLGYIAARPKLELVEPLPDQDQ